MSRKLKRMIYILAIFVLILLGITIWYTKLEVSETKMFVVKDQKEAAFMVSTEMPIPRQLKIHFEGELDCNARLLLRGTDESVKSRITFPLKAGNLKDKKLECKWHSPDFIVDLKSDDCLVRELKIVVKVVE